MVEAVCLGMPRVSTLSSKAKITRLPPRLCSYRTKFVPIQCIENTYQVQTHNSCGCNELRALCFRHLVPNNAPFDKGFFRKHISSFLKLKCPQNINTMTYAEVIANYDGAKKRRYKEARELLRGDHRDRAWSSVNMFVKADRYSATSVYDKAPRAIQFRHPAFNLQVAKFLKPFEEAYYQHTDWTGLFVVAKGHNNIERAQNIVDASKMFRNPKYILLDHKKFDAHQLVEHILFLHRAYNRTFGDRRLSKLLRLMLRNRGFSKSGIRYTVNGTRMSGDYDTGLGNTFLNDYIIYCLLFGIKYHLLVDGDDSVIIIEADDVAKIDWSRLGKLGMESTYEIVSELHQIEFCRAKLLPLDPPRFARDPIRALSNMTCSFKHYSGDGYLRHIAGLGLGEASASNGVPIIGPIAWKMSHAHSKPIVEENIKYMYGAAGHPLEIDDEARRWVHEQYGISPATQLAMEMSYVTPRRVCLLENRRYYSALPAGPQEIFL